MTTDKDDGTFAESSAVWRYARAARAHPVVDADAYYTLMREAMANARRRIMLIGWDFDTRISLGRDTGPLKHGRLAGKTPPDRLGHFIPWLTRQNPDLEVKVLRWNIGALKALMRGSMMLDLLRWWRNPQIDFKMDGAHPPGCSHHQKIVVIDDCFAVCGGIDMTGDRWDTRDHLDEDPRRIRPNGEPYKPWHDATMLMEGEIAHVLGDYSRARWHQAGGHRLQPCPPPEGSPWPESLDPAFRDIEMGVSRTRSQYEDIDETREIEALFLDQIAGAKRFIYAESQYFASRRIAEAIALRMGEPDPPEIVLVNPLTADGWLEQKAMDGARIRLLNAIREKDHARRFSIWVPHTARGQPIYVHAKIMIVDDRILRIGSANMNNRSLGLDSECDVFIDSGRPGNEDCESNIRAFRHSLIAEHTGVGKDEVAALLEKYGSMATMFRAAPGGGRTLQPFEIRPLTEAEQAIADNEMLDPEKPEEMIDFYKPGGLFKGGILSRNS